jgi:hypothetical protein
MPKRKTPAKPHVYPFDLVERAVGIDGYAIRPGMVIRRPEALNPNSGVMTSSAVGHVVELRRYHHRPEQIVAECWNDGWKSFDAEKCKLSNAEVVPPEKWADGGDKTKKNQWIEEETTV